jgi:hypothetical protein
MQILRRKKNKYADYLFPGPLQGDLHPARKAKVCDVDLKMCPEALHG